MASPTIQHTTPAGINVTVFGELDARQREVLTDDALNFLAYLHTKQNPRRLELLAARRDARRRWQPVNRSTSRSRRAAFAKTIHGGSLRSLQG